MQPLIKLILAVTYLLNNIAVFASGDKFFINNLNHCKITKSSNNNYEPRDFQPSNNLLRSSGAHKLYCGEKIIIIGRVLDQNCTPVSDAKVYLWQVGCNGKYPYQPLRRRINRKMLNINNGSSFTGSGTATTNNLGEFIFVTIRPPANLGNPHVNVRVAHYELGELQTKLNISKAHLLKTDQKVSQILSQAIEDNVTYSFDIVLSGETNKKY